ncbi:MAG: protocatechuate 3,4-dioxygenase subunit alpha [Anaerolineae bacterium]|nr:protocatechuate 3,4-dioxygenase subunit alpha [Anaerolineae bacterium]
MTFQTGSQTVGPYLSIGLIRGGENTMVHDETRGDRIVIKGRVFDGDGQPINDAMIEIWQPDAQGYFNHPNDPNQAQADPAFRGFGRSDTTGKGFWFKTIKPGRIAGAATPYINVHVFSRGMLIHALTRLYFSDEAGNEDDPLLNSLPPERRATLIACREDFGDVPTYRFDVHLQGDNETVFFNS